jgi:hypothetical protein
MKIQKKQVALIVYMVVCFYGINWIAHHFLPKWIDILVGFTLSIYAIYKGCLFYLNRFG